MSTAIYIVFFGAVGILGLMAIAYFSGDPITSMMPTIIRVVAFNLIVVGIALTYDKISRQPKRTRCRRCAYDLRGLTDRCPRCGSEITAKGTREDDS